MNKAKIVEKAQFTRVNEHFSTIFNAVKRIKSLRQWSHNMNMTFAGLNRFEKILIGLQRRNINRTIKQSQGIDFSSNDYLGLSDDKRLRNTAIEALNRAEKIGSGGSRLLTGSYHAHIALEAYAAEYFNCAKVLFFDSGYVANFSLLSCLPKHGDVIIYDELVHASLHQGMKASKAMSIVCRHNDIESFQQTITKWRKANNKGQIWLVVESLYSMDGDFAPLPELITLADENDAFIIIDEAHATGIFGNNGRGLAEQWHGRDNVICVHTCGKALGVSGALVCVSEIIFNYLVNFAKPFIYSTAPSPLIALIVHEALKIVSHEPQRREHLFARINHLKRELERNNIPTSGSQIQPIILNDAKTTMQLAQSMQLKGFDIRGIRPPTVPENSSRLRISITLNVSLKDIENMVGYLSDELNAVH